MDNGDEITDESFPLEFTNISVLDAPLVKDYYWEWLNLAKLNRLLLTTKNVFDTVFNIDIPPMPLYSMPLKIILFIRNESFETVDWTLKRIKLCDCVISSIPTGVNLFKLGYKCPHRQLLTMTPTKGSVGGREVFQIYMYITYCLLGDTDLAYELTVNEYFKLRWNFSFKITEFDPLTCIITKSLFAIHLANVRRVLQPIWVFNHYNQDMELTFTSDEPGLEILTKELMVKKYSLTSLLVKYKPQTVGNLSLKFSMFFMGIQNDFIVNASGLLFAIPIPAQRCPKHDISTPDYPYIIFENYIGVKLKITEASSNMVAVHNFSTECVYFNWQSFNIPGLFDIEVSPSTFECKPNHTKLCLVTINAKETPCVFYRVPLACEVYRGTDPAILASMRSGGDGMYVRDSLDDMDVQTIMKRLWLNVNFRVEGIANIQIPAIKQTARRIDCVFPRNFNRNIFAKLLWNQIFGMEFLTMIMNKKTEATSYEGLFATKVDSEPFIDRRLALQILRMLIADAVEEISKRWRFIPIEVAYP